MSRVMQNTDPLLGRPVRSLQTMLRLLSQTDSRITSVIPDGIFGKSTLRSVSDFQRAYGLPVTGSVDYTTWQKLIIAYRSAQVRMQAAAPLLLSLGPDAQISTTQNAQHIWLIQAMLYVLHQYFQNIPPVEINGLYDTATQAAVKTLQAMAGLTQDGTLGKLTWKYLAHFYRSATMSAPTSAEMPAMQTKQT